MHFISEMATLMFKIALTELYFSTVHSPPTSMLSGQTRHSASNIWYSIL